MEEGRPAGDVSAKGVTSITRIAIVGLGLIGGSAALALRRSGHHVTGYARRPETRKLAVELGAADSAPATLAETVSEADIVLLAAPVLAIRDLLREIAPHLRRGTVVTDASSTKSDVERWALETLPGSVAWVGGHPMAGKETAGLEHADGALFRGRTWCIVPPPGADRHGVERITHVAADTGARTLEIDAAAHDRAVAAVSHLPFMAAAALADAVIASQSFGQIAAIAGSGLRDMTRLASGDATMHRDIVLTNRDNLIAELERYVTSLEGTIAQLRGLPSADSAADAGESMELGGYFTRLKRARDAWLDRATET